MGPLWLTPKVTLYNAGNDSNVYNDAEDPVASGSGSLRPNLEALLPIGKSLDLRANGSLGWSWYKDQDGQGSVDRAVSGGAELRVGPLTFTGNAGKGWARQRFSIEIDQRLDRTDESFGGGVAVKLGRRLSLGGTISETRYRFEQGVLVNGDAVSASLDRDGQLLQATASVTLTRITTLVFEAGRQEDTFVSDTALSDRSALSYRYAAGFNFVAGGLFTGQLRAGWRKYPENQEAAPGADGLLLTANLLTSAGRLGKLTLDGSRDITYAAQRVEGQRNSYVTNRYGASLDTELPLSLIARSFIRWEKADYVLPYERAGAALDRKDTVRTYGAGLLRAFGTSLRLGGTIEWSHRESDLADFGYDRRAYGITAEYAP